MGYENRCSFAELLGKIITEFRGAAGGEEITIICSDGSEYKQFHVQDCCEGVWIDDICGDVSDIIGYPILVAEESTSNINPEGVKTPEYQGESFTWTFYKLDTAKGGITIRWYGESNGYYSESVDFERLKPAAAVTGEDRLQVSP